MNMFLKVLILASVGNVNSTAEASSTKTNDINYTAEACCMQRLSNPNQKVIQVFHDSSKKVELQTSFSAFTDSNKENANDITNKYIVTHKGKLDTFIDANVGIRALDIKIIATCLVTNGRVTQYSYDLNIYGLILKYVNDISSNSSEHSLNIGIDSEKSFSIAENMHTLILAMLEQGYAASNVLRNENSIEIIINQLQSSPDINRHLAFAAELKEWLNTNESTKDLEVFIEPYIILSE